MLTDVVHEGITVDVAAAVEVSEVAHLKDVEDRSRNHHQQHDDDEEGEASCPVDVWGGAGRGGGGR